MKKSLIAFFLKQPNLDANEDNNNNIKDNQQKSKTLKCNLICSYKTAMLDLWKYEQTHSQHTYFDLDGAALEALMKDFLSKQD